MLNIDSYKIATFDRIHTGICCGTCRYSKSNTGSQCIMNSKQDCLGNTWDFAYKHWQPVDGKPVAAWQKACFT